MTRLPDHYIDQLDYHIFEGNIRSQVHPTFPLFIYNYTPQVQYSQRWDQVTRMCRGLILDRDHNIIARPFPKFFNWGEWDAEKKLDYLSTPHTVTEKLDGSLGILYHYEDRWYVATRGSFTSDQALRATAMLDRYKFGFPDHVTPLVEIIYPQNRIVVDYKDREELVLLATLDNVTGRRRDPKSRVWHGPSVTDYPDLTLPRIDTSNHTDGTTAEGYVVTFEDGEMVKIKFDDYVRLHRILTGTNAVRVWEALQSGDLNLLLKSVPDEFYTWVKTTANGLASQFVDIDRLATFEYKRLRYLADKSRKDFALQATQTPYADILFRILDGKDYAPNIWKRIRPEATKPFKEEI